MNYLAHLALSGKNPEIIVGNLMGDFMTKKQIADKSSWFQTGYQLHMFIDQFTDNHHVIDEICLIFKEQHGKYTPVVVDIILDYFLYQNWDKFYTNDFNSFEDNIYSILKEKKNLLPEKTSLHVSRLVEGQFLNSYKSIEGLKFVLNRMDIRAKFPSNFINAVDLIEKDYEVIAEKFVVFYKDLQESMKIKLIGLENDLI